MTVARIGEFTLATPVTDDFSNSFHKFRGDLADSKGRRYIDFVRALKPDFGRVYRDIALGYGMVAGSAALAAWLPSQGVPVIAAGLVGAVLIGFWIAYLQLFIHEGSHFNLAADRAQSDRLCDLLISWIIGTSVKNYRKVHFQHHRALGTVEDSEHSYFFPLNLVFIAKTMFAIRAVEVLLTRARFVAKADAKKAARAAANSSAQPDGPVLDTSDGRPSSAPLPNVERIMLIGISVHLAVLVAAVAFGSWALAIAWGAGIFMFFPFFGALRQLLEHRAESARDDVDYAETDHGAVSRMFGTSALACTLGGAGFNRHLLHHWEPQVSYTNLAELEAFIADTPLAAVVDARRTTYTATFLKLFH